jgi:hypothetical protein
VSVQAEAFVFKSPEEVVERLELLEDDKLGSFDQLLRVGDGGWGVWVTRRQQDWEGEVR